MKGRATAADYREGVNREPGGPNPQNLCGTTVAKMTTATFRPTQENYVNVNRDWGVGGGAVPVDPEGRKDFRGLKKRQGGRAKKM